MKSRTHSTAGATRLAAIDCIGIRLLDSLLDPGAGTRCSRSGGPRGAPSNPRKSSACGGVRLDGACQKLTLWDSVPLGFCPSRGPTASLAHPIFQMLSHDPIRQGDVCPRRRPSLPLCPLEAVRPAGSAPGRSCVRAKGSGDVPTRRAGQGTLPAGALAMVTSSSDLGSGGSSGPEAFKGAKPRAVWDRSAGCIPGPAAIASAANPPPLPDGLPAAGQVQ